MDLEPPPADMIGNYRVLSKLGQGGMGAVFKAVQGTLERPCALKLLPPELSSNHEYVQRFLREARSVAQLRHDNIVQVYDAGQDGGRYYIAMELVDGTDLQTHIEGKGTLTEAEGLALLMQAAKGLAAAHAKGLVHRDIKPHNLLMDKNGMLRIVDFGLVMESTSTTQLTATGACLGTPTYMSPEQADGEQADARTDVYSLGVTFYRVFTGQLPFNSNTVMNLLFKHKFEAPPDPKALRADLSENVRRLLLHMVAKKRDDRPQDAAKVVEMIEAIRAGKSLPPPPVYNTAGGTSIIQPPPGGIDAAPVTAVARSSRTPLIAAGLVAAVVIVAVLVVVLGGKTDPRVAKGDAELQAGRPKEALDLYRQALAADPDNDGLKTRFEQADRAVRVQEMLNSAKSLETSGDLNGAMGRYGDAAALDSTGKARAEQDRVKALLEKKEVLSTQQRDADRDRYSKAATDAEKAGQFETAAEHYSRAAGLADAPLKAVLADKAQECRRNGYLAQAVKEEQRGNLTEAEQLYRRAQDIKRDALVEQQLADLQKKKSQPPPPNSAPYDVALRDGQRALDAGDFPTARKKFNEALTAKNHDPVATNKLKETDGRELIARGDALRAQGRKDDAISAYTESIQKWPPLGIEATQRIQAATVGTAVKTTPATPTPPPINTTPVTTPVVTTPAKTTPVSTASSAGGAAVLAKVEGLVRENRDNEALQELHAGLRAQPASKELFDAKEAFDSLQGALGVYNQLGKIITGAEQKVAETLEIGDESRIRETSEKLDALKSRASEKSLDSRDQFVRRNYNAVRDALRIARSDANDLATELAAAHSYLEARAERASEGKGVKLPFGGVRLGVSGDKKKAERFRTAGEGFRRLADEARAQAK